MCNENGKKKERFVKRKQKNKKENWKAALQNKSEGKREVLSKRENKGRREGGRGEGGGSMSNHPKRRIRHGRLWLRNISAII
jgi:hypothetical protein